MVEGKGKKADLVYFILENFAPFEFQTHLARGVAADHRCRRGGGDGSDPVARLGLERRREGVNSEGFTLPSSSGSASLKLTATAHWKATSCRVCIVWRLRPCMLHMRKHKIHHRSVGF